MLGRINGCPKHHFVPFLRLFGPIFGWKGLPKPKIETLRLTLFSLVVEEWIDRIPSVEAPTDQEALPGGGSTASPFSAFLLGSSAYLAGWRGIPVGWHTRVPTWICVCAFVCMEMGGRMSEWFGIRFGMIDKTNGVEPAQNCLKSYVNYELVKKPLSCILQGSIAEIGNEKRKAWQ